MKKQTVRKQVRETKAGKSISAWIILNAAKKHVATVNAHYADGGTVTVDVWHMQGDTELQQGKASGYGYDKLTAALSGLVIDGHMLYDACRQDDKAKAIGASFANWEKSTGRYGSLFTAPGMDYLEMIGYTVIRAI